MEDAKITQSVIKRHRQYRKWFAKMEEKGFVMDKRAQDWNDSVQSFANKMDEMSKSNKEVENILKENPDASVRKFKGTILDEMKSRSFQGGSRKQVNAFYNMISKGMEDLKTNDEDAYNQLNEKYGFAELEGKDLAFMEMKGANLMNKNRNWMKHNDEQGGTLDLLYLELAKQPGISMQWDSPY